MRTPQSSILTLFSILLALPAPQAQASSCELPKADPAFLEMLHEKRELYSVSETRLDPNPDGGPYTNPQCLYTKVVISGKDPIKKTARDVRAVNFLPRKGDHKLQRTVIIMPPTGGENTIDRLYAELLCKSGIRAVLLQGWDDDNIVESRDLTSHNRAFTRGIAAIEDLIKYIGPKHGQQLGILGTSLGAIGASLLLSVDHRVNTGVLIVGGSGIPEIMAKSKEPNMVLLRTRRKIHFGFHNSEEYRQALEENLSIEPEHFVKLAKPKNVLSFLATKDSFVPTQNQFRLYSAFGEQEAISINADHIPAILGVSLKHRKTIVSYFQNNLQEATGLERALSQNDVCANLRN